MGNISAATQKIRACSFYPSFAKPWDSSFILVQSAKSCENNKLAHLQYCDFYRELKQVVFAHKDKYFSLKQKLLHFLEDSTMLANTLNMVGVFGFWGFFCNNPCALRAVDLPWILASHLKAEVCFGNLTVILPLKKIS